MNRRVKSITILKILIKRPFNLILRLNYKISEIYKALNSKKFFNVLFTFFKYFFLTYILISILASVFFKISLADVFYYHLHILNTGLLQRAYSLFVQLFEKLYDYLDLNNIPDTLKKPQEVSTKVENTSKSNTSKVENISKSNPSSVIQQKFDEYESLRKKYDQPLSKWKFDILKAKYLDGRITFEQFYNLLHELDYNEPPQNKVNSKSNFISDTLHNHPIYSFVGVIVVGGLVVYLFSNGSLESASGVFVNYFTLLTSWVTGHETIISDTKSDVAEDIELGDSDSDRKSVKERLNEIVNGRSPSPVSSHKSEEQDEWGKLLDGRELETKTPIGSSQTTPHHSRPTTPTDSRTSTPKTVTSILPDSSQSESGITVKPDNEYDGYFHNPLAIEESKKFFNEYGEMLVTNKVITSDELKDYQAQPRGLAPGFKFILIEDLNVAIAKNSAEYKKVFTENSVETESTILESNVEESDSDGSEDSLDDGLPKMNNMNE